MNGIAISFEDGKFSVSNSSRYPVPLEELSKDEQFAINLILEALNAFPESKTIHVEKRSTNYLSIIAFNK